MSSWFSAFAESATSSAPESERVAQRAPTSGMPTSFSTPVVRPRAQVRAEAALGPAPAVVGEPDRGDERLVRDATVQPTSGRREPR